MPSILTRPSGGGAAGGTITVALSDATPNIGDTITITATATGFTPDSYIYFGYDGSGNIVFIAEQASNTFDWLVPSDGLSVTEIYVLGVENGSPDVTAFSTADITVSSSFLLDTPEGTGANFAFAFFRLRADYTDPIALIRRSSDNAQKAFYFDSNNVLSLSSEDGSGTSLSSWIGSDDGYLVTGYSQDTLGVTFTASSAADQYQIINGGSLIELNGIPCVEGDFKAYAISVGIPVESWFAVAKNNSLNSVNYIIGNNSSGFHFGGIIPTGIGVFDPTSYASNVNDLTPHIASIIRNDGIYVDGTFRVLAPFNSITVTRFGERLLNNNTKYKGKIAVVITYNNDKSSDRASIEANINDNFATSLLP